MVGNKSKLPFMVGLSMSQAELGWENNWAISPLLLRWDHVRNYLYTKMPQNVTK